MFFTKVSCILTIYVNWIILKKCLWRRLSKRHWNNVSPWRRAYQRSYRESLSILKLSLRKLNSQRKIQIKSGSHKSFLNNTPSWVSKINSKSFNSLLNAKVIKILSLFLWTKKSLNCSWKLLIKTEIVSKRKILGLISNSFVNTCQAIFYLYCLLKWFLHRSSLLIKWTWQIFLTKMRV
jgi:hypothetical protein